MLYQQHHKLTKVKKVKNEKIPLSDVNNCFQIITNIIIIFVF